MTRRALSINGLKQAEPGEIVPGARFGSKAQQALDVGYIG
jgi:hypothetical protein